MHTSMNFTHYTLGEALSSPNETIKRAGFSILKQLMKQREQELKEHTKKQPRFHHLANRL